LDIQQFRVDRPSLLIATATSTELDPALTLARMTESSLIEDADVLLTADDIGADNLSARLQYKLDPGTYLLIGRSADGRGGSYELEANLVGLSGPTREPLAFAGSIDHTTPIGKGARRSLHASPLPVAVGQGERLMALFLPAKAGSTGAPSLYAIRGDDVIIGSADAPRALDVDLAEGGEVSLLVALDEAPMGSTPLGLLGVMRARPGAEPQLMRGVLDEKDPIIGEPKLKPYQDIRITLDPGLYAFELSSSDFDALLELRGGNESLLVSNDDGRQGSVDSRIVRYLSRAGDYILRVGSADDAPRGAFVLKAARMLGDYQAFAGSFNALSPRTADGIPEMRQEFTHQGGPLEIRMTSDAIDSQLKLETVDGRELAANDDAEGSLNSILIIDAPAGNYVVVATTASGPEATGDFDLVIGVPAERERKTLEGNLDESDSRDTEDGRADTLEIALESGDTLFAVMMSEDFDSFLRLRDTATGQTLASDDDGAGGSNARLTYTAGEPTTATLVLAGLGGEALGTYALTLATRQAEVSIYSGDLTEASPRLPAPAPRRDLVAVQLAANQAFVARISEGIAAKLALWNKDDVEVPYGPLSQGELLIANTDARTMRIAVEATDADSLGAYTLRLDPLFVQWEEVSPADFSAREVFAGTENPEAHYTVSSTGNEVLEINLIGRDGFDGTLTLYAPDGSILGSNDDYQNEVSRSYLMVLLSEPGDYTVGVSPARPIDLSDDTAQFDLSITGFHVGEETHPEFEPVSAEEVANLTPSVSEDPTLYGLPAPDFDLPRYDGSGNVSLEGLRGKVVVIDFWATWCSPCLRTLPDLQRVYEKYRGQNVEIIGVSDDAPASASATIRRLGLTFPTLRDPARVMHDKYLVDPIPRTLVIGTDGIVAADFTGVPDITGKLEQAIDAALNPPPVGAEIIFATPDPAAF